jgi:hypothetical protein
VDRFGADSRIWISEPGDSGVGRWDPLGVSEETGIILEWNSQKIVLVKPEAKKENTIQGDQVIRIEPTWTNSSGETIQQLFVQRQFKSVVAQGNEAIHATGTPLWQQRLILAEMIDSSLAIGKPMIAGQLFESLAKENPPQLLLASIPIPWGNEPLDPKIESAAEKWILLENEAIQLMGASWLLGGSKRSLAIETLTGLCKSKTPLVASYARCQLWRTVPPADIVSGLYPKWIAERDRIPLPMQAGPTMLLANRLEQAGQLPLAIGEWLRIAMLHPNRYHLAKPAFEKSIAALKSLGKIEDAKQTEDLFARYQSQKSDPIATK